jgi:DNA-binding response OmpR family regulator
MSIPAEPVLIVDDDEASCRFMAEVLAGAGYRVEWTTDDDGALERVHRSRYALVIADVTMPGVSGTEIVADLGRVRPGAPALLVSGFAGGAAQAAARRLGVPLLAKPFAADLLLATVRVLTTRSAAATAMSHEQDSVSGGWTGLPTHGGPASTIRKDAERG